MTEKLYDTDSTLRVFTAQVVSCEADGRGAWSLVLDRTAFFPEGGGQGADHGTLGGVQVTDVHEKQGVITHTVTAPLPVGDTVEGVVDDDRRRDMTQQHSGEHIYTGIIHSTYGYDNVGFHIGTDAVTLDFNGPLTEAQVLEAERRANEVIWRNTPITARYPSPEELAAIEYRSKKAIDGPVRIVTVEGIDVCACCGTHVHLAGEVGIIKVIGLMNYKGGVRVSILCGSRALDYLNGVLQEDREISHVLSAKPGELTDSVSRILTERDALRRRCDELSITAFAAEAARETGALRIVISDTLPASQLRKAAGQLAAGAALALVAVPRDGGWSYALSSSAMDVRPAAKALHENLQGKGGGAPDMVQGVLSHGTREEIQAILSGFVPA